MGRKLEATDQKINNNYDLELIGISLDDDEKDFVGKELFFLDRQIPPGKKIQLQISKKKNSETLQGTLRVPILNQVIESSQDGANVYQLYKKLAKEINFQAHGLY